MEKTQRLTGTNKANRALKIAVECCRVLIGVVFIFSGFVKAVDPMGGAIKIDDYLSAFGLEALQPFSVVMSFNLSAIEFTLGVCTLLGVYRRYVSFLVLLFMAFMTPLTLYLALFNPVSDCGCFGDAIVLTNWETSSSFTTSGCFPVSRSMSIGLWHCMPICSESVLPTTITIICRSLISVPIRLGRIFLS